MESAREGYTPSRHAPNSRYANEPELSDRKHWGMFDDFMERISEKEK